MEVPKVEWYMMFIGFLDKKILITKMQRVFDGRGGWIEKEVPLGSYWSSLQPLSIGERVQYNQLDAQVTMKVFIRFNPEIDNTCFMTFKGKKYRIMGVINPSFQNEFSELVVSEA